MAEQQLTNQNQKEKRTGLAQASLVILPLIILAIVIWVFLKNKRRPGAHFARAGGRAYFRAHRARARQDHLDRAQCGSA